MTKDAAVFWFTVVGVTLYLIAQTFYAKGITDARKTCSEQSGHKVVSTTQQLDGSLYCAYVAENVLYGKPKKVKKA